MVPGARDGDFSLVALRTPAKSFNYPDPRTPEERATGNSSPPLVVTMVGIGTRWNKTHRVSLTLRPHDTLPQSDITANIRDFCSM